VLDIDERLLAGAVARTVEPECKPNGLNYLLRKDLSGSRRCFKLELSLASFSPSLVEWQDP